MTAETSRLREGAFSFPLKHKLLRFTWRFTWLFLGSWTPVQLRFWRVFLLRLFGAKIGARSDVRKGAKVWFPPNLSMGDNSLVGPGAEIYNMAPISIGRNCIISQGAFLCGGTHDVDDPMFTLITKPIIIEDDAWIAADAFVGPGGIVGRGAVLGARAVTSSKLAPWTIYAGNPARPIRERRWQVNEPEHGQ